MRIEDDNYWHTAQRLPYVPEIGENDTEPGSSRNAGSRTTWRDLLETVTVTLLIFFMSRAVVQSYRVEGSSMLPTLRSDEYLFVNKGLYFRYDANYLAEMTDPNVKPDMHYLFHGPQRGDIVVFASPVEPIDYIKRVIAVAGETVRVKADPDPVGDPNRNCGVCGVYVNGVKLKEPYVKATPDYDWPPAGQSDVIPPGYIFVMGDNRRNSSDSHIWGPLDESRLIGTAFVSYWPKDSWGLLPHPTYANQQ